VTLHLTVATNVIIVFVCAEDSGEFHIIFLLESFNKGNNWACIARINNCGLLGKPINDEITVIVNKERDFDNFCTTECRERGGGQEAPS
jgi:hypothetical protein